MLPAKPRRLSKFHVFFQLALIDRQTPIIPEELIQHRLPDQLI